MHTRWAAALLLCATAEQAGPEEEGRPASSYKRDQSAATQSISTRAPLGSPLTWTVARAGGA